MHPPASSERDMDVAYARHGRSNGAEHSRLDHDRADQHMLLHAACGYRVKNEIAPVADGAHIPYRTWPIVFVKPVKLRYQPFIVRVIRTKFRLQNDLGGCRHFYIHRPTLGEPERLAKQSSGDRKLVIAVSDVSVRRQHHRRRVSDN